MIDRVIGKRYVIKEAVGTGGMAVVYRAWDTVNKRTVAIKVLRPELETDTEFVRRFSREAEAASKVSHENIVNMLDVGKDEELRYIVMEYVDGQTLKELIRSEGRIRPDMAVRMAIRILAAVDHAHRNGIVHRDIKPQNILVDKRGTVKVADFGIARLKTAQTTRIDDGQNSALGSVHYFSPEQASGEVADEKSDLYSVGVVMYEMLTGQVPFDGETAVSVALKHVSEEPRSMRTLVPDISRGLDDVVLRALSKDAKLRYQTAAEMAGDLRNALAKPSGGFVKYPSAFEEKEPSKREKKRRNEGVKNHKLKKHVIMGVSALIILGILITAAALLFNTDFASMPYVVGLTRDEAVSLITGAGFEVSEQSAYSEDVDAGLVISQSISEGQRKLKGSNVTLTLSVGSQWIFLDDLTGMTIDEVRARLSEAGVKTANLEYVLSEAEPGLIVGQEPESGWITRETVVMLYASGEHVVVPNLIGLTLAGAQALIESSGLKLGDVTEGYSTDITAGTIIGQGAPPDSKLLLGSEIDLTVSQSQEGRYYADSYYSLVVPLDNLEVRIMLEAPSGNITEVYSLTLNKGTHLIELSSAESGVHILREYMDGVLMEETEMVFN